MIEKSNKNGKQMMDNKNKEWCRKIMKNKTPLNEIIMR